MERIEVAGIAIETEIAGSGPPLLFLHGGDYVAQNAAFLDRLARRFRVIAPRHPGFGATPRPAWFRTVHDIAYLYLDLLHRLDLADTLLVGHSFGGWVALEMAVRSEARLGRLVLIDAVGVKFGSREERDIADIYALPADEVLQRSFVDPARAVPDYAALGDADLLAIARDREATALYGWKPYMHDPALLHWLHRVTRPALVLWGEADGIVTAQYGERLAAALPDARFARLAGAAHFPQVEQPEAVATAIERFTSGNQ
ncbi:MAG TPA: alpha/beta hydrolase [Stellaceae bacterium]|jgi:pimeloyl-ACP methyl ester carboxylesterase|nr:alpha/beta hydrolase [Stellaceae bacterium]